MTRASVFLRGTERGFMVLRPRFSILIKKNEGFLGIKWHKTLQYAQFGMKKWA